MVDQEIFSRRLERLAGYLQKLKAFQNTTREEFVNTDAVHDLAERYLHLMMECVLDLCNHYIAGEQLGIPDTYRDSFVVLKDANKLDPALAEKLMGWASFRNILVHEYLAIDHGLAWQAIREDLAHIESFYRWAVARLKASSEK